MDEVEISKLIEGDKDFLSSDMKMNESQIQLIESKSSF
jgi:hypothetical protein